jgi:glucose-inhibited division protein A
VADPVELLRSGLEGGDLRRIVAEMGGDLRLVVLGLLQQFLDVGKGAAVGPEGRVVFVRGHGGEQADARQQREREGDVEPVAKLPAAEAERVLGQGIEREYRMLDLLRRPGIGYEALMSLDAGAYAASDLLQDEADAPLRAEVIEQIEIAAKYAGYIDMQKTEVERAAHYENLKLPPELDYLQVGALSMEVRQKLDKHRPHTLGQASRISGVTPAAISLLLVHLRRARQGGWAADRNEAAA